MLIKFKRLHPDAVIPSRSHADDFGYDVTAVTCEEIAPNVFRYGLGFAIEPVRPISEKPTLNVAISFRPRSSVWKTGMVLSNCTGTIDESYRGEISAVFYRVVPGMEIYQPGDRIGQIFLSKAEPIIFKETDRLTETERGEGGYGSTGR